MGKKAASKAEPPTQPAASQAAAKTPSKAAAGAPKAAAAKAPAAPKQAAPPPQVPAKAGAAAPKATAKASGNTAEKAKSSAKAKPAPAKAAPPPQPEEDEDDMEDVKKKKKKKKKADGAEEEPAAATAPAAKAATKAAAKAAPKQAAAKPKAASKPPPSQAELNEQSLKKADAAADKDADVIAVKKRITAITDAVKAKAGAAKDSQPELHSIIETCDKLRAAKRVPPATSKISSLVLEHHLQEMIATNSPDEFIQDTKKHLESARASELYRAICARLTPIKTTAEDLLRSVPASAAVKAEPSSSPTPGKGKGRGEGDEEGDSRREASAKAKLAKLHDMGDEDTNGAAIHTKTLELSADTMKYLFSPPHSFSRRFEDEFKCVIDTVRGPKGKGKGERPPPKELTITGLTQAEVDSCAKKLGGLDFSGSQTRDLERGMDKWARSTKEIEDKFNVLVHKRGREFSILGPKKSVDAAWADAEKSKVAEETFVNGAVAMDQYMAQAMRLHLNAWGVETNAKIDIGKPSGGEVSVQIRAKDQAGLSGAKKKIEEFQKSRTSLLVKGDLSKVKDSRMNRRYRELRDNFIVKLIEVDGGVQLVGPGDDVKKQKEELEKIFKLASYEPVLVPVDADKVQIFSRENTDLIRTKSGAEVLLKRGKEKGEQSNISLVGSDEQVAKAKEAIEEIVAKEGTSAEIDVSEDTAQALISRNGGRSSKIMELQHSLGLKRLRLDTGRVYAIGSASAIESVKKEIEKFSKQVELAQADTIEKVLTLSGMPDMRTLRNTYSVQAKWVTDTYTLELRGTEEEVAKAEKFVQDAEKAWAGAAKPAEKEAPARKPKKAAEYKGSEADFPTLGGEPGGKPEESKATSTWGSKKKDETPKNESKEAAYPTLGGGSPPAARSAAPAAAAPVKAPEPAPVEEEEADAGDMDDPFAMMSGMGEEQVYKVTLVEEAPEAPAEEAPAEEEAAADEGEEDAGDMDDPFAMMSGMGEEQVYKVTLVEEAPAEPAAEEPAPAPAEKASAPAPAEEKKPEEPPAPAFAMEDDDFPTLGGPAPAKRGGAWGKK